jgi:hypothetical protein
MLKILEQSIRSITSDWAKAKRQADRQNRVRYADLERMRRGRSSEESIKDAAHEVMEKAYMMASGDGTLPANARQIMYAARPLVLEITGGRCWKNSAYFTQHLLPEFVEENPKTAGDWDVVFDARGHLREPHTEEDLGLGTLAVRDYIGRWTNGDIDSAPPAVKTRIHTVGPQNRYKFALFVEKEGFNPLLEKARIAERYDLAIMSTKGMSVTAARELVENLSEHEVTTLVLHDFDKSGFSILATLRSNTRRYTYASKPNVVDLGLRLADVKKLSPQSEPVQYSGKVDPRYNLRENGATKEECDFLVSSRLSYGYGYQGQRVELNAMTSRQFINWLEAKLKAVGVEKVIPDKETLRKAFKRAARLASMQEAIDNALDELEEEDVKVPRDLEQKLKAKLKGTDKTWDDVLWQIATK